MPDNTSVYEAGEESLDRTFRDSAPRTEIIDAYGGLVDFDYSPGASLTSATGSGYNFTPPTVTSRPRSLMGADQLGRYNRGRSAADLRQLTTGLGSGRTYSDYAGVLENPGSYSGGLSKSQLYSRMRGLDYQLDAAAAADREASGARGNINAYLEANPDIAASYESQKDRLGAQSLEQFARNHYNTTGRAEMAANKRGLFTLVADKPVYYDQPGAPFPDSGRSGFEGGYEGEGEDYNTSNWNQRYDMGKAGGVTRPFAHGGSVKKPQGFADGGTAAADLEALGLNFASNEPVRQGIPIVNTVADVAADTLSGMFGPIAASAASLGEQIFTDNTVEEMAANKAAYNEALNYTPRTEEGQAVSDYAMGKLGEGVTAGINAYNENKDSLGPIPGMIDYGMEQYNELDPATQFALGNALTVGEVVPIGKVAGMAKRGASAKMLDELDAVNAPRADLDFSATVVSKMQEIALRPSVASDPVAMRFLNQIMDDPDAAIAQYAKIGETNGGKIINTDLVRELSPDYLADRTLAFNVHQPASALSEIMFNRRVAETMGEEGTWIFTGGGPASGKTAGLSKAAEDAADLVMDGTLAKFAKNDAMIEKALESGKDVQIVYIDRDPLKALPLALMRGMQSGRPVPLMEFARMHRDARSSVRQLHEKYKDNPNVDIKIVDNQGKMGEQFETTIDKLSEMDYDKTLTEGFRMLEEARLRPEKIGSVDGGISEAIYQGTKGAYDPPAAQSKKSRAGQANNERDQGNGSRDPSQQTGVNALEVGVDESLSGGQRLRNYTPDNLKTLEELATKATAGTQKADALINAPVEAGSKIGIRLNLNSKIPDAPKGLDKLQTLHKNNFNGKALSYVPYATVENVTFNVNQKGRQGIAAKISNIDVPEAKNKYPAMSVDGNYVPDKNVFLSGKDFVEIGFNPKANHLFIDMNTGQAVKGADLATVVGDRVYARGVQYYKKSEAPEVLSASDGTELPSQVRYKMKRGGSVERVYNDRRYI